MRVIRHTQLASPSAKSIREPHSVEQEVHRFASSLNRISNPVALARPGEFMGTPALRTERAEERRAYSRVRLALPLRVHRIAGQRDPNTSALRTHDISSSGIYFLSPCRIEPGTPIELELLVVHRPLGPGSVRMRTEAHVVRSSDAAKPGWHGVAAAFDDIRFSRDEPLPPRFDVDN